MKRFEETEFAKAEAAGLSTQSVCRRRKAGWTEEEIYGNPIRQGFRPNGMAERARKAGLKPETVYWRLKIGWTEDEALSTPPQPRRRKK